MAKLYIPVTTHTRIQSSEATTLKELIGLRERFNLSPTEAAVYFLITRRNLGPIEIAASTGMRMAHVLTLRRDALRKVAQRINESEVASSEQIFI